MAYGRAVNMRQAHEEYKAAVARMELEKDKSGHPIWIAVRAEAAALLGLPAPPAGEKR
jgi:hypothetical protein